MHGTKARANETDKHRNNFEVFEDYMRNSLNRKILR